MKYFIFIFFIIELKTIALTSSNNYASIQCFNCTSSELETCATSPSYNLPSKTCLENQTSCITSLNEKGNVIRDCFDSSNVGNFDDKFEICNETLCNVNPFPKNRLICYNCEGDDCFDIPTNHRATPCPIYKNNDKCFTQIIDEQSAVRGCISSYGGLPHLGVSCEGKACNDQNGFLKMSCFECNSETDNNCKTINSSTKKCQFEILLGRTDEICFTYHKFDKVIRGSYRDSGSLALEHDYFKPCRKSDCNNEIIKINQCIVCGPGTKDPECVKNTIENCQENTSSCHACTSKSNIFQRGCGKSPSHTEKNVTCYQCQENDGCNIEQFGQCFKCDSKFNSICTGIVSSATSEIEFCESSKAMCLTTIDIEGNTQRGCSSDKFNTDNKVKFNHCTTNLCNKDLFPANRRYCFRCNGDDKCNLKQDDSWAEPCERYVENDGCFEYIQNGTTIIRGCKSDATYKDCINNSGYGCYQCLENNCNKINVLKKEPELSCYVCNENDTNCQWSQEGENNLKNCQKHLDLNVKEQCYVYTNSDGNIKRGCYWDDETCSNGNMNCTLCANNLCNNEKYISEKCIQIKLDDGDDYDKENLERTLCKASNQTYETRGCYINRNGDSLSFGCISDLTSEQIDDCKNNPRICHTCTDKNCESMKIPEHEGKKPRLNCYKCTSEKHNHCQWKQNEFSIPCMKYLPRNAIETCFIRKDSKGNIERGCSYDEKLCLTNNEEFCEVCDKDDCNSKVVIPQKCIQEIYKLNEKSQSELNTSDCTNQNQYWTNQGCYVNRNGNNITWGCIVDLNKENFEKCLNETTKCSMCKGLQCSNMKVPNSASELSCLGVILIFSVIFNLF